MPISNLRTLHRMGIPLALLSLFTAGCCCCLDGSDWTPTASPHITNVSDANFTSVVLKSEKPTLVDFWASWCKPCQLVDPAVVAIAEEYQDRIEVARLDVDQNPGTCNTYQIWGYPTLALFANGELVGTLVGVPQGSSPEAGLRDWLDANLPDQSP